MRRFCCLLYFKHIVVLFFFLMIRLPPTSKRTNTHFPDTTLFRSNGVMGICVWLPNAPYKDDVFGTAPEYAAAFKKAYGVLPDYTAAGCRDRKSTRLNSSH